MIEPTDKIGRITLYNGSRLAVRWRLELQNYQTSTKNE